MPFTYRVHTFAENAMTDGGLLNSACTEHSTRCVGEGVVGTLYTRTARTTTRTCTTHEATDGRAMGGGRAFARTARLPIHHQAAIASYEARRHTPSIPLD